MKFEWATVKDGLLHVGSFGKEYTNSAGEVVHTNNLWVLVIDKEGRAVHVDWTTHYLKMRQSLGVADPGYMIHEAVAWSPVNRRWFVLPRRVSKERYDEVEDEKRGSNVIISAAPDFSDVKSYNVGVRPSEGADSGGVVGCGAAMLVLSRRREPASRTPHHRPSHALLVASAHAAARQPAARLLLRQVPPRLQGRGDRRAQERRELGARPPDDVYHGLQAGPRLRRLARAAGGDGAAARGQVRGPRGALLELSERFGAT
jgi:hypothetical protein